MKSSFHYLHVGFTIIIFLISFESSGQTYRNFGFTDLVLKIDTNKYAYSKNLLFYQGNRYFYFRHTNSSPVCELDIYTSNTANIAKIDLLRSADYELLDSIVEIDEEYFRVRLKFKDLSNSAFLSLLIRIKEKNPAKENTTEVKLFPFTNTSFSINPENDELFIGEEKVFEIGSNFPRNILVENTWTTGESIDYKLSEKNGTLRLHVLPNKTGIQTLNLKIQTIRPFLNESLEPVYKLPPISYQFNVKNSRLAFLNIDKKDIILDDLSRKGVDIQIDNNRNLVVGKTYRIENNESPGSTFIGEIYTRNRLSNDKVLCFLRVFNYHKNTEGYLYIKDGDKAEFVTNCSIIPRTIIEKVSVLREGGDWTENTSVYPGESVEVKIEGQSLHKANFYFEDIPEIKADSFKVNENISVHKLKIPLNFSKRKITILNNKENTGYSLLVREYQEPKSLNFVNIDYGEGKIPVTQLNKPILYKNTIKDVIISFDPSIIETEKKLFGKQFLRAEIKLFNQRKELIDFKNLENIVICPEDNSPRLAFYTDKNCNKSDISLNRQLSRKTYDLDDWYKIEITISHDATKYGSPPYSQKVEIFLAKSYRFDIDVSFPGGLLLKKYNRDYEILGGISTAVVAQFSFYQPGRIDRLRPYRIGAGFIALNAFNFNKDADKSRDVGIVVLASVYPTRRDVKFTFPLYAGYGYLLRQTKWFFVLGPGIQVRF
jgi:hypothetical protein